ncbi:hypothetical protein [Anaerotalea alkaliphila]|uniref:Uncharacterized protein n=1 Tax=Anaerotalea alkaliphila TaxID=2662126 RepID=A0A7X5KMT9_9FIRM|nr:hypothetical protein [Anaerotalea alkaliphila]NDL68311.1 hypothetical protein [Anaerotalea alkaliphila]
MRKAMHEKRLGKQARLLETSAPPDTAFLQILQVHPLSPGLKAYFDQAEKVVLVENNASGQLGDRLKLALDVVVHERILKCNGEPFSIEGIDERLGEVLA